MKWTVEIDIKMMELWDQGMPARKIGEVLGTTKGSVIGRHRRLTVDIRAKSQPVIDAHPMFDPVTNTWFLDEIEAETIRQLLGKLPKGSTIKDYVKKDCSQAA